MKSKLLSSCCWIVAALAICLATAAVRSGPVGLATIAWGLMTAAMGTAFCLIAETTVQRGLRTTTIGFVILLVIPLAPIDIATWSGIFICVASAVAAIASAAILSRLHRATTSRTVPDNAT